MKGKQKINPERFYHLDTNMSIDKIIQAQNENQFIVGIPVLWDSSNRTMKVDLGNGYFGFIPAAELSVYPAFYDEFKLTANARYIIGAPICVMVKKIEFINNQYVIALSRRDNMLNSFQEILSLNGQTITCCITSFSSFGIFVDAGHGICGLIHCRNLCASRLRNSSDLGMEIGDFLPVKITGFDEKKFHVCLDYKSQFENMAFVLSPGNVLEVTILNRINSNSEGRFAYINPNTLAIINIPKHVSVHYLDKVIARVRNSSKNHPDKVKLEFINFS